MAHFAQLDENNVVIWVTPIDNSIITDENGQEQESLGIKHLHDTIPWAKDYNWKQTSYNNNIRGRYAGIGYTYDEDLDAFITPKPHNSWILNKETLEWEPPTQKPNNTATDTEITTYEWNEQNLSWDSVLILKPYSSWTLDEDLVGWSAPIPRPDEHNPYEWNEENQSWDLIQIPGE